MATIRAAPVTRTFAQPARAFAQPAVTYAQPATYAQPTYYQQPTTLLAADLNHDGIIESNEVFAVNQPTLTYAQPTRTMTYAQPAPQLIAADLNHDGIIEANEVFAVQPTMTYAQPAVTYAQPITTIARAPMVRGRDLAAGYTVIYEHAITREELLAQGRLAADPARDEQLMLEASRIANFLHNDHAVIGIEVAQ